MKNQNILVTLLLVVLFTSAGFFGGMKYQQSKVPTFTRGQFGDVAGRQGASQQGTRGGARLGGGQIMGDIISVDDKSITIKMTDGSSKIILISSTTSINKSSEGTIADLKVGDKVATFGTTNTDGSVTAANIQLNPIVRAQTTISPTK
jgi:hypothetical protein